MEADGDPTNNIALEDLEAMGETWYGSTNKLIAERNGNLANMVLLRSPKMKQATQAATAKAAAQASIETAMGSLGKGTMTRRFFQELLSGEGDLSKLAAATIGGVAGADVIKSIGYDNIVKARQADDRLQGAIKAYETAAPEDRVAAKEAMMAATVAHQEAMENAQSGIAGSGIKAVDVNADAAKKLHLSYKDGMSKDELQETKEFLDGMDDDASTAYGLGKRGRARAAQMKEDVATLESTTASAEEKKKAQVRLNAGMGDMRVRLRGDRFNDARDEYAGTTAVNSSEGTVSEADQLYGRMMDAKAEGDGRKAKALEAEWLKVSALENKESEDKRKALEGDGDSSEKTIKTEKVIIHISGDDVKIVNNADADT